MSEENVQIVRRVFESAARHDTRAVLAAYHPDVELDSSRSPFSRLVGGGGVYHGHEELRKWFRDYYEAWEHIDEQYTELIDAGRRVVSVVRARARGRASGAEVEMGGYAGVWTIRDGKIAKLTWFATREEALEAAGLSEEASVSDRDQEITNSLRGSYEAFSRGDFDTAIEIAHPEVEFVPPGGQSPLRGADAFRAWMDPDALEDNRIEPSELRINGNKVLVRHRAWARGATSGIELDFEGWVVWTLDDDGLATRIEAFLIHEESDALEAAGLSE